MQYPPTELVLDSEGKVYHLGLKRENISENIILVGDQNRVDLVAELFENIEHASQHREFSCKTGSYKGKRISVLSTGIGTDNIDICINELDALFNIDLKERKNFETATSLNLIRIGTCGILNKDIPVHSYILSSHAFGLDNVAHFYEIETTSNEDELCEKIKEQVGLPSDIHPYLSTASTDLFKRLSSDQTHEGITITSSGFYGPQGRQLRLNTKTENLNERLISFEDSNHRIVNFEMESSALFALGNALGHQCATICLGIANRPLKDFSSGYQKHMTELIRYVLDRI